MTIMHATQGETTETRPLGSPLGLEQKQKKVGLYIDRSRQQWVVLDKEGDLWILPSVEHPWDQRQPFSLTEETELEAVPGHYKHMLGLPF